jgi:hypothetical protein
MVKNTSQKRCGLHVDHSLLTALTSATFVDESKEGFPLANSNIPEIQNAIRDAGLYIQTRGQNFIKADIPNDCIAFQLGGLLLNFN